MNTAKRIFDVHILESNRSGKTAEGEALGRVLDISGIRTHHYPVHTVDELASAFGKIAKHPRCLDHHRHFLPFLHFALHASDAGVFVKRKLIRWGSLRELLGPSARSPSRQSYDRDVGLCWILCLSTRVYARTLYVSLLGRDTANTSRLEGLRPRVSHLLSQSLRSENCTARGSRGHECSSSFAKIFVRLHFRE
jgi:hypothetical protein